MSLETAPFLMSQDWVHPPGDHERQLLTMPRTGEDRPTRSR